jgi:hypothetical protein
MQQLAEKRAHERYSVRLAIFVEVLSPVGSAAQSQVFRSETVDVSAKGLRLWSPEPVAAGRRLHLAIPLENLRESLELEGTAVWSGEASDRPGYWVGLQLDDASREDMERWFLVVQRLRRQASL